MTPTLWGYPEQPSGISAWMTQYAPWLLIGGLVILAFATNGSSKK